MKEHGDTELTLQLTFALKQVRPKNSLFRMPILHTVTSCVSSLLLIRAMVGVLDLAMIVNLKMISLKLCP